jgi:hypothetical protein
MYPKLSEAMLAFVIFATWYLRKDMGLCWKVGSLKVGFVV